MRNLIITLSFLLFAGYTPAQLPKKLNEPQKVEPKVDPKPSPKIELEFVDIPVYRNVEAGSIYGDVLSHVKGEPYGDKHGRSTNVHETAYGIHSELRNEYIAKLKKRVNAFYCGKGKAVIVDEPGITITQIVEFIPENMRSYRYDLYLVQQAKSWNEVPLYIFDEWNAYVLDGMCSVDDVNRGVHRDGKTDAVSGCMDFSIYAIALAMTVEKYDNEYWKTNKQFKNFLKYNLKRANETFLAGYKMDNFLQFKEQEKLLKELLESPKAEKMRKFLKDELDGLWLDDKTMKAVALKDDDRRRPLRTFLERKVLDR